MSGVAKIDIKDLKDTLENLIAGLNTEGDKRSFNRFVHKNNISRDDAQLDAMYRTDWVCGKVIDIVPDDMTREWRTFTGNINPDAIEKMVEEEKRLQLRSQFNVAHRWSRLYGGSLIIMAIDDGGMPWDPLDMNKVKEGSLRHIKVVDRTRVQRSDIIEHNPLEANFGMPQFYRLNETSIRIHHSRVIRFDGIELPYREFRRNNYWSDSVLARIFESVINLVTASDSSASMIFETNVDVLSVEGLMDYLQTEEGTDLLRKRFMMAKTMKSFNNMLLLDGQEEFETKTNTFSGLPDLLDKFMQIVSAASDIPATRLLGKTATGLNADGSGDLKNYYDAISAKQENMYGPKLDKFDQIMAKNLGLPEDADLKYVWNSLFQMTDFEKAEIQNKNSQRDATYLDRGIVTEDIVASQLMEDGVYTNITNEYIEELKNMVNEPDEEEAIPADPEEEESNQNVDPEQENE